MSKVVLVATGTDLHRWVEAAVDSVRDADFVGQIESPAAYFKLLEEVDPEVTLVDEGVGPVAVEEFVRKVLSRSPSCAVIVVIRGEVDADHLQRYWDAGARSMVRYPSEPGELESRIVMAGEWSTRVRGLASTSAGRVIAVAGSKGGVGTTSIATHMALEAARLNQGSVCLVDLDVDKGDVSELLGIRWKATLGGLARSSADLSDLTVTDAMAPHPSGLEILLAPSEIDDARHVRKEGVQQIVGILRARYAFIVMDVGSHVTPLQAWAVLDADEVVMVMTPDLLSLRALKRTLARWKSVEGRAAFAVHVLLNRVSAGDAYSHKDIERLLDGSALEAVNLPTESRTLESFVEGREPSRVKKNSWGAGITALTKSIVLGKAADGASPPSAAPRSRSGRSARGEEGSITVETVVLFPLALSIGLLCWQVVLVALSFVWAGHATDAAARSLSVNRDPGPAARRAVPDSLEGVLRVSPEKVDGGTTVTVSLDVPFIAPGWFDTPFTITSTRTVVREP